MYFPMHKARMSYQPAFEDTLVQGASREFGAIARWWEDIQPPLVKDNETQTIIRCCSYNVLCQTTIGKTIHLYKNARNDPSVLDWDQRWRGLSQNLLKINADIVGLQEVEETHFWTHFSPFMRRRGYGAHYVRKESPQVDGCALFYRIDKFEGISALSIRYFLAEGTTLDKPQIAQIVRLRCKTTNKHILVANTPIVFNMKRGDIKMAQIATLLANIDTELKNNGNSPVIILGDFNMEPNSHIYKFMTSSRLCFDSLRRNTLARHIKGSGPVVNANQIIPSGAGIGQDCRFTDEKDSQASFDQNVLTHPFNLQSVYASQFGRKQQGVSTYHTDSGNPDFIFYSDMASELSLSEISTKDLQQLRLIRRMSLPQLSLLRSTLGPWPNRHVPSDHIPLVADFQLHA